MDAAPLVAIAAAGGLASPLGGLLSLWLRPGTLGLSLAVGFAGGALLGAFAFEMLPRALEKGSLPIAIGGFALGFAAVYVLDLLIHRGHTAGQKAAQHARILWLRRRERPLGDEVTVLAGGTSAEEVIEGLTIGVSAATEPSLGLIVALAICIDNVSEAMSIGDLVQEEGGDQVKRRILGWTSLIGLALFASALAGWFLLRDLRPPMLALLLAAGAGGMFYLTVTQLVPQAQEHQYQQSAAMATAAGMLVVFALSNLAAR